MKRVQKKEKKYYKKEKYCLACKKREIEALLVEEAVLQIYKEELNAEEEEVLEEDQLSAE